MTGAGDTLPLAGDARDLAVLAERAARHDPGVPVRLVADGSTLGVFVQTPFDCLGMRAVRLATPASIDAVVEAVGLSARARQASGGLLVLPPRLPDMSWTTALPPRSGWAEAGRIGLSALRDRLAADTQTFRLEATQVGTGPSATRALQRLAEEIWARPLLADAPVRLAHAADYLGFLPDDAAEDVIVRTAGPWRRVDARYGVSAVKLGDPLGVLLV